MANKKQTKKQTKKYYKKRRRTIKGGGDKTKKQVTFAKTQDTRYYLDYETSKLNLNELKEMKTTLDTEKNALKLEIEENENLINIFKAKYYSIKNRFDKLGDQLGFNPYTSNKKDTDEYQSLKKQLKDYDNLCKLNIKLNKELNDKIREYHYYIVNERIKQYENGEITDPITTSSPPVEPPVVTPVVTSVAPPVEPLVAPPVAKINKTTVATTPVAQQVVNVPNQIKINTLPQTNTGSNLFFGRCNIDLQQIYNK